MRYTSSTCNTLHWYFCYIYFINIPITDYRSAFGPTLNGIAFSSVLMQRNSPKTVIIITLMIVTSHQVSVLGNAPLYIQHIIK